jgi:hypothetical protein
MATFSQQFLANLGGAGGMLQGASNLGAAIGGVPGQIKDKRKQEEFDKLITMINQARINQDAAALNVGVKQLQALGHTKEAAALIPEIVEGNTLTARRAKVGALAVKLKAPPEIVDSIATMQMDELLDIAKTLRTRGLDQLPTSSREIRLATAKSVGISEERFDSLKLGKASDDAFKDFISGQGGELEFFVKDGAVGAYRTKNGLIWDENQAKWLEPGGLGLSKPVEVSRVENIANKFGEDLGGEGAKLFVDEYDAAKKSRNALEGILKSQPTISNMFTGKLSRTKVEFFKLAKAFGIPIGDIDSSIVDNETYAAEAGKRVASYITNLGAGTGLSDADRDYAELVTGGKETYSAASLKEVLGRMEIGARREIKEYENTYQRIKGQLKGDAGGALMYFPETLSIQEQEIDVNLGAAGTALLDEIAAGIEQEKAAKAAAAAAAAAAVQ